MSKQNGGDKCGAKKRNGSGACSRPAGWGTDHFGVGRCKFHGGCVPNHRKAAQKELAKRGVEQYGLPVNIDPQQALMEELHRTAGHVAWLGDQVRELEEHELHGPVGGEGQSEAGVTYHPREEPHIWLRLYQEERKHLTDVAATCIRAGIEERRVKLAEQQGQLIATAIKGILKELGVDPFTEKARRVVRTHLTTIEGDARELEAA